MALNYSKWDNLDDSDDETSGIQRKPRPTNGGTAAATPPLPPALAQRLAELSQDPGAALGLWIDIVCATSAYGPNSYLGGC